MFVWNTEGFLSHKASRDVPSTAAHDIVPVLAKVLHQMVHRATGVREWIGCQIHSQVLIWRWNLRRTHC